MNGQSLEAHGIGSGSSRGTQNRSVCANGTRRGGREPRAYATGLLPSAHSGRRQKSGALQDSRQTRQRNGLLKTGWLYRAVWRPSPGCSQVFWGPAWPSTPPPPPSPAGEGEKPLPSGGGKSPSPAGEGESPLPRWGRGWGGVSAPQLLTIGNCPPPPRKIGCTPSPSS